MQFHLDIQIPESNLKIKHQDVVLMIGSCFSEHIYTNLHNLKFKTYSNPFGIIFNPESIYQLLNKIVSKSYFTSSDVFEKNGFYYSLKTHSLINAKSEKELLDLLNRKIDEWHQYISTAKILVITFGSAFAYQYKQTNQIVANCHKLPSVHFQKNSLSAHNIVSHQQQLLNQLSQINPTLQVLYTVSPVKHLKDGVVENNLSKAILIQSVHQLVSENQNVSYFPAYELVNDDLRDYRYYEKDLAHPNALAVDYVWEKFSQCYFNASTIELIQKITQINQAVSHRLFNEFSEESIKFKNDFLNRCKALCNEFPFLDLRYEIDYFTVK